MLEGEARPLHTDRREQDELPGPGALRRLEERDVGTVIDAPGVLGDAGPRGDAGEDRVHGLVREHRRGGRRIRELDLDRGG